MIQDALPFPRGTTFREGDTDETESTVESNFLGAEFQVLDTEHDTKRPVTLKLVKNASGSALAANLAVTYRVGASALAGDQGRVIGGYCDAIAERAAGVVDDAYGSATIADDDLFYIVRRGPVDVTMGDIASSVTYGDQIVTDNDSDGGKVGEAATDAAYAAAPLGIADETASAADAVFRIIAECP